MFNKDKVQIGIVTFNIKKADSAYAGHNMGLSDVKLGNIFLSSDMPVDITINTLLHEICHVIYNQYGLRCMEDYDEEQIVECMSNGITDLICNNPKLIKKILKYTDK